MKDKQPFFRAGLILFAMLLAACSVGEDRLQSDEIMQERQGATEVDVNLEMTTGNLTVTGGASVLLEGDFTHQFSDWSPRLDYVVERGIGHLELLQRSISAHTPDGSHYVSNVRLLESVPIRLHLTKEDGDSTVQLDGLTLMTADVALGEGADVLSLEGNYTTLTTATFSTGAGADEVNVSGSFPSLQSLSFNAAAGEDVLSVEGTFDSLVDLTLDGGADADNITVDGDYPLLETLTVLGHGDNDVIALHGDFPLLTNAIVDVGIGEDTVDLNADWQHDLTVTVISESETANLQVPADVGVLLQVNSEVAEIQGGMDLIELEENVYANGLFGEAEIILTIRLNTASSEAINVFQLEMME